MNGIYQYIGEAGVFEGLSPGHAKMLHDAYALDIIDDDGHVRTREREDIEEAVLEAAAVETRTALEAIAADAREAKERAEDVLSQLESTIEAL